MEALELPDETEPELASAPSRAKPAMAPRKTQPRVESTASAESVTVEAAPANTLVDGLPPEDQTFKRVTEQWKRILQTIGQRSKQTQALLNSCKPFGMKDGVLFLGFNGEFAKTKMEKGEHMDLTRQTIQQVLGLDLPMRCFVAAGRSGTLPPDVESDGMVAAAMRDLGGELVDVQ